MIKIGFKDVRTAKRTYADLIAPGIAARLEILKTSLIHLSVKPNSDDPEVKSFKVVTEKIINHFQPRGQKIASGNFNKATYEQTVTNYVAGHPAELTTINLNGLISLIERLVADQEKVLRKLLIAPPEKLHRYNNALIGRYKINSKADIHALGLGMDWTLHSEVTDLVKDFFHGERQVVHCPYCNINRAFYSDLATGEVSSNFALDHFYTKTDYPLLTYCMFNLVPCDHVCNGSDLKGAIPFSYEYHLNPYEAGMDRSRMIFRPNVPKGNQYPTIIELVLVPPSHDRKYQQLVGNFPDIDETRKVGNINVFRLQKNYNEVFVLKHAGRVNEIAEDLFRSRYTLKRFMKKMKRKLDANSYQRFYYKEFGTEFLPKHFHIYTYSKLVRDIHDNVLERDKSTNNNDIKKFVQDHPA